LLASQQQQQQQQEEEQQQAPQQVQQESLRKERGHSSGSDFASEDGLPFPSFPEEKKQKPKQKRKLTRRYLLATL